MAIVTETLARAAQHARTVPGWRTKLASALEGNRQFMHSRFVQLATVRPDGRPSNRTVVFRGFLGDDIDDLAFCCDSRSKKMKEIAANPHAEVAWYFTETREQFRLAGKLDIVDASSHNEELNKTRQGQWSYMSDALRQQFTWPEPGQPVATDPEAWTRPAPSKEEIPDEFVLLVLNVEEVEYLLLGDPHRKVHYIRNAAGREGAPEWAEAPVNP